MLLLKCNIGFWKRLSNGLFRFEFSFEGSDSLSALLYCKHISRQCSQLGHLPASGFTSVNWQHTISMPGELGSSNFLNLSSFYQGLWPLLFYQRRTIHDAPNWFGTTIVTFWRVCPFLSYFCHLFPLLVADKG